MANESEFVEVARKAAQRVLPARLLVERGAVLLYEVAVDNHLELTVNPHNPRRGNRRSRQTCVCSNLGGLYGFHASCSSSRREVWLACEPVVRVLGRKSRAKKVKARKRA